MVKSSACSDTQGNSKSQAKESNINVFVRCRPINSVEQKKNAVPVLNLRKNEVVVRQENNVKQFAYDHVFGPNSTQLEVFQTIVEPMVHEVLLGYNCTMFAYGQTGTGKTFTMEGERTTGMVSSWADDPLSGIIPRTLHMLFDKLEGQEFTVKVSYIEIYNEELMDLMSDNIVSASNPKLKIFEDNNKKGAVILQGVEEITVKSRQHVYAILEAGSKQRKTAETLMNAHSSRSHSVFSITVNITGDEEFVRTGKLNLVDLAGSENIGRSGAVEMRAQEAGNINRSLLTLGRCITSLVEKKPHVPYRESKLTRILQDSLGGRTKTSMIATVSPASINLDETLSTLEYAYRARRITNKPEVNQKMTKRAVIKQLEEEIERLKKDLTAQREQKGIFVSKDNYEAMETRLSEQSNYIHTLEEQIADATEEMLKMKTLFNDSERIIKEKDAAIEEITSQLRDTEAKLEAERKVTAEQKFVIASQEEDRQKLKLQTQQLTELINELRSDNATLQSTLKRKIEVERSNEAAKVNFDPKVSSFQNVASDAISNLIQLNLDQSQQLNTFIDSKVQDQCNSMMTTYKTIVFAMTTDINQTLSNFLDINSEEGLEKIIGCMQSFCNSLQQTVEEQFQSLKNELDQQRTISKQNLDTLKLALDQNRIVQEKCHESSAECTHKYLDLKEKYELMSQTLKQISEMQRSQAKLISEVEENMSTENLNFATLNSASERAHKCFDSEMSERREETLVSYNTLCASTEASTASVVNRGDVSKKEICERTQEAFSTLAADSRKHIEKFTTIVSDNFEKSSRDLEKEMLQFGAAVSAANEEVKTKCREDWVHTANSHLQQLTGQVSEHNKQAHRFIAEDLQRDKPTGSTPVSKQSRCPQNIYFGDSADVLREKYRENMKQLYSEEESERKVSASQKRLFDPNECYMHSNEDGFDEVDSECARVQDEPFEIKREIEEGDNKENEDMNRTIPMDQFYLDNKPASQPLSKWKGSTASSGSKTTGGGPHIAKRPKLAKTEIRPHVGSTSESE